MLGVVCAVALIGVLGLAAMAFRKRQLSRQAPDAAAAVVYDREARTANDDRTMVGNGSTASIGGHSRPNSGYHEFFPPNLDIQNATTTYNSV